MNINKYSNPSIVMKKAKELHLNPIQLSSRKDKKYMVLNPKKNKMVHFGFFGMEDYTKHKDEKRRELFRKRNHKWATAEKYSPAWLSYYLTW